MPESEDLTQKELAKRLGITTREVRNLHAHGIPRKKSRRYPWPKARHWYIKFKQVERERRQGKSDELDLRKEQARKTAAQADKAELELGQLLGDLYHRRDVERLVRTPIEQVDAALRNAPSRHAAELAEAAGITVPVAAKILSDMIEQIRTDLRKARSEPGDDLAA